MNENIFSGKAEVYMQCRPRYAQGVLDFIRRETALTPDSLIADIGAGTGIFTAPGAEIISAPAEHTGLPDGSVSLITAAESFHWFQPDDFREECRRILRPDGKVMIVWNLTDKKTSTVQRLHELNMKYCEKYRSLFTNNEQFSVSDEKYKVMSENYLTNSRREIYPNDLMFTKEQFIGNRISRSYAPKSGDPEFDNYRTALEEFFEQHQQNGVILIPNNTVCFIGMA